ncbi:MAG: hypothetical protein WBQ06_11655 [Acidobacteriaceae bacterium]
MGTSASEPAEVGVVLDGADCAKAEVAKTRAHTPADIANPAKR